MTDNENKQRKTESTRQYDISPAILELKNTGAILDRQITSDSKICLIGDGQGLDTREFLELGVKPENIASINYEASEVEDANTKTLKDSKVIMRQGDATDIDDLDRLGLRPNSLDAITLMHILEVPNIKGEKEKALVRNMAMLLKPGGELIVSQYKHKFTKMDRDIQRSIGIEEISPDDIQKQYGDQWKQRFNDDNRVPWEEGMRYGEISNIRTKEELIKLFEPYFHGIIDETENEFILRMVKK